MFGKSKLVRLALFASKPVPIRKRSFKPGFEALEKREVRSVSTPFIHAVAETGGTSAVFYINEQNHAFYEHDAFYGTRELAGPNTVQSFSAGVDLNGRADVFVKDGDGSFWEYSDFRGGWQELLGPNVVQTFAAVKFERVYVQYMDDSLHEFDGAINQWTQIAGKGTILAIDAVTDAQNNDAVFVLKHDDTFGEFYDHAYQQLAAAVHRGGDTFPWTSTFSAGTDLNGNADVYAKNYLGTFEKNVGGVWSKVAAAGAVGQFSATDNGQVWFIASNNWLEKYDGYGVLHDVDNGDNLSISAAASNDVFVVNFDDSLWERTAEGVWSEWSGPGTVQQ